MTLILGLTGGIATGKSTADQFFKKKKIPVIDADEIAHHVYDIGKPALQEIKAEFGDEILNSDQTVNRKKLGQIVFQDPEKLEQLNQIVHPRVFQEIMDQIVELKEKNSLIILDVPLLFESHGERICDQTLVITAPEELELNRLMIRDHLSKDEARRRIDSQMPLAEKEAKATYVVANTGTIKTLEDNLEKVLLKIKAEG